MNKGEGGPRGEGGGGGGGITGICGRLRFRLRFRLRRRLRLRLQGERVGLAITTLDQKAVKGLPGYMQFILVW